MPKSKKTLRAQPVDPHQSTATAYLQLDGRTLEGGGQLVRNALALSAITRQPVSIHHIRGNRQGKAGLKTSHTAAVQFLADITGSEISGVQVGSQFLSFVPAPRPDGTSAAVKSEYEIHLPTVGSIFLVFQAVYPYLLSAATEPVRLDLRGGTNVSFSPSYDYVAQVLAPNFRTMGLPQLSIHLHKRGWSGPNVLGDVSVLIHPLGSSPTEDKDHGRASNNGTTGFHFPFIDLTRYGRGKVTAIEITVLASDEPMHYGPPGGGLNQQSSAEENLSIRQFTEQEIQQALRLKIKSLPSSVFQTNTSQVCSETLVPINIHTSEATDHRSHMYLLIVAHTTAGLRLASDALFGDGGGVRGRDRKREPGAEKKQRGASHASSPRRPRGRSMESRARELVERCVDSFAEELFDEKRKGSPEGMEEGKEKPCVDVFMRDQMVVFEALGRMSRRGIPGGKGKGEEDGAAGPYREAESYWSLHTQTAKWVCRQLLKE